MKALILCRVSTEEQARDGVSLAAQEAKARAYCQINDLEVLDIIIEAGKSGKEINRDGLQSALARIEAGEAQALVVYSLSRLSRRVVDTLALIERIEKAGAAFHSISEKIETISAVGKFFLTVVSALAELERNTLAERTAMALAHIKAEGKHVGRIPYGHTIVDGRLVKTEEANDVITLALALRSQKASLQAIADALNARGIPSQKGGQWYPSTVSSLLRRAG